MGEWGDLLRSKLANVQKPRYLDEEQGNRASEPPSAHTLRVVCLVLSVKLLGLDEEQGKALWDGNPVYKSVHG